MSLYILAAQLCIAGIWLSAHHQRATYRDTWAAILVLCGVIVAVVRSVIDLVAMLG